jgi:hypothetical protein
VVAVVAVLEPLIATQVAEQVAVAQVVLMRVFQQQLLEQRTLVVVAVAVLHKVLAIQVLQVVLV